MLRPSRKKLRLKPRHDDLVLCMQRKRLSPINLEVTGQHHRVKLADARDRQRGMHRAHCEPEFAVHRKDIDWSIPQCSIVRGFSALTVATGLFTKCKIFCPVTSVSMFQ
jgi:hypothetical protein